MYAEDAYRELCKRGHRLLGLYLALWAWVHRLDCVVIKGDDLRKFLDVSNIRKERLSWIERDVNVYFRHMVSLVYGGRGAHASLYLSRKKFPSDAFKSAMKDELRVVELRSKKLRTSIIDLPSEKEMLSKVQLLVAGVEAFPVNIKALYKRN